MMNNIQVRYVGARLHIALVTLRGFLDTVSAYRLQQEGEALIESGTHQYIINLQLLEYISSAGLETLHTLTHKLQPHRGQIILVHVPKKIYKIFDTIGITAFFEIRETIQDAIKELEADE
jgi:anti-sigma B factor antagonist